MKVLRIDGSQALSVGDAHALVSQAEADFRATDIVFQQAKRVRDAALARLNEAQQAYDRSVGDLRGFAPRGSLWNPDPSEPGDGS